MNNSQETTQKQKRKRIKPVTVFVIVSATLIIVGLIMPQLGRENPKALRLVCGLNMKQLSNAIGVYTHDNNDLYPTSENWCDLLLIHTKVSPNSFLCKKSGAIKGESSYEMNVNISGKKHSEIPPDVVLLFETKAGWNQHGGPELITTENHKGKGCNMLFNNGTVKFINKDQINTLKWK